MASLSFQSTKCLHSSISELCGAKGLTLYYYSHLQMRMYHREETFEPVLSIFLFKIFNYVSFNQSVAFEHRLINYRYLENDVCDKLSWEWT